MWISQNIDKFYKNEKKRRNNSKCCTLSKLGKDADFKEKQKYEAYLNKLAEILVLSRHVGIQVKKRNELRDALSQNVKFEKKVKFIDKQIEDYILYFNQNSEMAV